MITGVQRHKLLFGGAEIPYHLTMGERKYLSISVHPDLAVHVTAPIGKTIDQIERAVHKKARWILRQRRGFERMHPLQEEKKYVSGETHHYLGRQYRLRVVQSTRERVTLQRPYLVVEMASSLSRSRITELVEQWYAKRAEVVLQTHFDRCLLNYPSLATRTVTFKLRRMKRRWGSCTPLGVITLNPALVRVPPGCIEYVIVHELCHRKVMNHGARFQRLLDRYVPDWVERRLRLNQF